MRALHGGGWLAHVQRDSGTARKLLEESLSIAEELQDDWSRAWVLHALGRVAYFDYDADGRGSSASRVLRIAQALDDRWLIAWALHLLALAAYIAGDDCARACVLRGSALDSARVRPPGGPGDRAAPQRHGAPARG